MNGNLAAGDHEREKAMADEDLLEKGRKVRQSILGAGHADRAARNRNDFNADFQDFLLKYSWAEIWSRPGLDIKTRSMITVAMLVAMGRADELKLHVRASANTGITKDEMKEILMHAAIYAGVPAAFNAFQVVAETYAEMERK